MRAYLLLWTLVQTPEARLYRAVAPLCHDGDTCSMDLVLQDSTEALGMGLWRTQKTVLAHQTVRLCGLNAPELGTQEGSRAKEALAGWVTSAKTLELHVVQQAGHDAKDKYGRWLGWIVADGQNLNERLLQEGLAAAYGACR